MAPSSRPPMAGPTARATVELPLLSRTALPTWARGTCSPTAACQAGRDRVQQAGERQDGDEDAAGQFQQHAGQHDFAPVIVVGKHPGQDGQGHQREGGGHLDHGDHQGAALFGGDDPGGGDGLRPGAQVGEQVGAPDAAERGEG
ncbi:hypothetical protein G6F57_021709 [Rhizopus arrhizus]|nr:hypothetical protein G6F57_021709 [Rhizopus arrhizus]